MHLLSNGRLERANPYGPAPTVYTRAFWSSGEANRLMFGAIAFDGPVRLLHGHARRRRAVAPHRRGSPSCSVQPTCRCWLVKDGDHRLSRDRSRLLCAPSRM